MVEEKTSEYKQLHEKADDRALEHFTCVLTCCDYLESLIDSDVLCLSMNVTRSEVAIADPTKIRINDIFETVVSGRQFLNGVLFRQNQVNNVQGVHGGFDIKDKDAVVIKGKANENISGVFPFFITEEHWEIANMLNRMLVGWLCTLDIFGFDYL